MGGAFVRNVDLVCVAELSIPGRSHASALSSLTVPPLRWAFKRRSNKRPWHTYEKERSYNVTHAFMIYYEDRALNMLHTQGGGGPNTKGRRETNRSGPSSPPRRPHQADSPPYGLHYLT